MLFELALYLIAFILLWFGSGIIVNSVNHYTKSLRLSPFITSFFVLGILTSIPELAVGLASVVEGRPEVFVGNLFGGVLILFLLIIPLLAIVGNGIRINHNLNQTKMLVTLGTILAPAILVLDRKVSNPEGVLLIVMYIMLFIVLYQKNNFLLNFIKSSNKIKKKSGFILLKIIFGIIIVTASSHLILTQTFYFAEYFKISPYLISLFALSLGTNLPELSIAIHSIVKGEKEIAFGNYMGSASANTLLFGIFTILNNSKGFSVGNFLVTFFFLLTGLSLFFKFSLTKKEVSRKEGLILFSVYLLFICLEFITF